MPCASSASMLPPDSVMFASCLRMCPKLAHQKVIISHQKRLNKLEFSKTGSNHGSWWIWARLLFDIQIECICTYFLYVSKWYPYRFTFSLPERMFFWMILFPHFGKAHGPTGPVLEAHGPSLAWKNPWVFPPVFVESRSQDPTKSDFFGVFLTGQTFFLGTWWKSKQI